MFKGCSSFNRDLSRWDVSKVKDWWDMWTMFKNCSSYKPRHPLGSRFELQGPAEKAPPAPPVPRIDRAPNLPPMHLPLAPLPDLPDLDKLPEL
jgi:surface protein